MGLAAAARAADRYGIAPAREHRTVIRATSNTEAVFASTPKIVAMLRAAKPTAITGHGSIKALRIYTQRSTASKKP